MTPHDSTIAAFLIKSTGIYIDVGHSGPAIRKPSGSLCGSFTKDQKWQLKYMPVYENKHCVNVKQEKWAQKLYE